MDKFIKIRYNMRAAAPKEQAKHHNGWIWERALLNVHHISSVNIEECIICMSNGGSYTNIPKEDIEQIVNLFLGKNVLIINNIESEE